MRRVFKALARAGIARRDLVLAWDFTVASCAVDRAGRCCTCATRRSRRWATPTSPTCGRGPLAGVHDHARRRDCRRPSPRSRASSRARSPCPASSRTRAARSARASTAAPTGSRPRSRATPTPPSSAASIPRDVPAGGARALLYGHGLLGSPLDSSDFAQAQLRTLAHERGFTVCGTYWSGLSGANGGEDTVQVAAAIQDLSEVRRDRRPAPAGHAQQPVPRPRDGGRRRPALAPGVRGRVRRHAGGSTSTATRWAASRAAR